MTAAMLARGSRFGDLRLTGYIGRGGFSDVYEAFDASGRRLAVKVLRLTSFERSAQSERISREREALARVDSRGVARLLKSDLTSDMPWIASEFVDGPTIRESIERRGPIEPVEALGLVRRLAEILTELHGQGIAHRDLTPNNVIFGPEGPVIIDFGSARIDLESEITGSLLLAGTQGYTAPEALRGEVVGRSADVFALGRIAQYCITGSDDGQCILPDVLDAALADEPAVRPRAHDVAKNLDEFGQLPARHITREVRKLPRRFSIPTLLVFGLVTAALSLAFGLWWSEGRAQVTAAEVLGQEVGSPPPRVDGAPLEFTGVSKRWSALRRRPADLTLGYSLGDLEAWEFRIGTPPEGRATSGPYGRFEFKLANRFLAPGAFENSESGDVFPADIAERTDRTADLFEFLRVPDGCALRRVSSPELRQDGSYIWLAGTSGCDDTQGRLTTAGLIWSPTSNLVVEWISDTNIDNVTADLLASVSLRSGYRVPDGSVDLELRSGGAFGDFTTAVATSDPASEAIEYVNTAFDLAAGSAVLIESGADAESQISLMAVRSSSSPGGQITLPAGRWWQRYPGEQRILTNPFKEPIRVYLEADSLFADTKVDLQISPTEATIADSLTLDGMVGLGGSAQTETSNAEFLLPEVPASSADASSELTKFVIGGVSLPIETSLPGQVFSQADGTTQLLRADDTWEDYELSWLEDDDAHWFVTDAKQFEYSTLMETSDWISAVELRSCNSKASWRIETAKSVVRVQVVSGCDIEDNIASFSPNPQAAPIVRFGVGSSVDYEYYVVGSFVPESLSELERFRSFLAQVVNSADQIVDEGEALYRAE